MSRGVDAAISDRASSKIPRVLARQDLGGVVPETVHVGINHVGQAEIYKGMFQSQRRESRQRDKDDEDDTTTYY